MSRNSSADYEDERVIRDLESPKVLIVAEGGDAGGIGRYCVDLATGLGVQAQVACLCDLSCTAADPCWLRGQCAARDVHLRRIHMPSKGWLSGLRGLSGLWRRTGRPMIHVNGRRGNSVALALRFAVPGFRYVTTVHGVLGLHSRRNAVYRVVDLAAGRFARAVIAVSEHGRGVLVRAWSPKDRTLTIANGLAASDLGKLRRTALHRRPERHAGAAIRVGFLGRLSPEKGTRELLEIARQLSSTDQLTTLLIAGDGPDRAWLMNAGKSMIESGLIEWRGTVLDPGTFLGEVDVLVIPSHNEGLPYALLEGMAAGCAVVAFAVGGIPEVITDPNLGILIEPGDVNAFVRAVARLTSDPDLVRTIGTAASSHIERHFALANRLPAIRQVYGLGGEPGSASTERPSEAGGP